MRSGLIVLAARAGVFRVDVLPIGLKGEETEIELSIHYAVNGGPPSFEPPPEVLRTGENLLVRILVRQGPSDEGWHGVLRVAVGQFEIGVHHYTVRMEPPSNSARPFPPSEIEGLFRIVPSLSAEVADGVLALRWSARATDYFLESTGVLGPETNWVVVHGIETDPQGEFLFRAPPEEAQKFFRLRLDEPLNE